MIYRFLIIIVILVDLNAEKLVIYMGTLKKKFYKNYF